MGEDGSGLNMDLNASREEVEKAFREMVTSLKCPTCHEGFTDFAVTWGDAWLEGRTDLLREEDRQERDGPFKLKCELCGSRSWLNYFAGTVTSEVPQSSS